jgi:two-component system phosphate regulon response regulator PhoB
VVAFKQRDANGHHFEVNDAASLEKALDLLRSNTPDILFLELVLSGKDSREMAVHLEHDFELKKIQTFNMPAPGDDPDASLYGYPAGGDGTSPDHGDGLSVARLRVVPKKQPGYPLVHDGAVRIRDLVIHPGRREVFVGKKKIRLTFTLFNILWYLAQKPGWVFSFNQLIDAARGPDANIQESSLKVHIYDLRKRLGRAGGYIEAVPGVGYRLRDDLN